MIESSPSNLEQDRCITRYMVIWFNCSNEVAASFRSVRIGGVLRLLLLPPSGWRATPPAQWLVGELALAQRSSLYYLIVISLDAIAASQRIEVSVRAAAGNGHTCAQESTRVGVGLGTVEILSVYLYGMVYSHADEKGRRQKKKKVFGGICVRLAME